MQCLSFQRSKARTIAGGGASVTVADPERQEAQSYPDARSRSDLPSPATIRDRVCPALCSRAGGLLCLGCFTPCTEAALLAGIAAAQPEARIGDISAAISKVARDAGYGLHADFGGHGGQDACRIDDDG
jgi:hypothetical protein